MEMITDQASPGQLIRSLASSDLAFVANLPARLNDAALANVEAIANSQLPTLAPIDDDAFLKSMRILDVLPSKGDDELRGTLRLNLYRRHFGQHPAEAWMFALERATIECRFFPSPAELSEIFARWHRSDDLTKAQSIARHRLRQERQDRFDDAKRAIVERTYQLEMLTPQLTSFALQERLIIETANGPRYWTRELYDAELARVRGSEPHDQAADRVCARGTGESQ